MASSTRSVLNSMTFQVWILSGGVNAFIIADIDPGSSSGGDSCHRCIGSSALGGFGVNIGATLGLDFCRKYLLLRLGRLERFLGSTV